MVYIILKGHDFVNEVYDVVNLFYPNGFILIKDKNIEEYSIKDSDIVFISKLNSSDFIRDPNDAKKEIKRQLYITLSQYTKINQPWGMLTGIRPSKIVHDLVKKGFDDTDIKKRMTEYYKLLPEKADLLLDIVKVQKPILQSNEDNFISLYIGIPFCPSRCLYCSFGSTTLDKKTSLVIDYLKALKKEMFEVFQVIKERKLKIKTLYIGGGTPTSISETEFTDLLNYIEEIVDIDNLNEYSIEAGRPDSITKDKLKIIKDSKVTRISINPQTMNDETLKLIERNHTVKNFLEVYTIARDLGFNNINMDLIVGLPGENEKLFENTLKRIADLEPNSLTIHTLAIKRASLLNENKKNFCLNAGSETSKMLELASKYTKIMNLHEYYIYRQKNMLGNFENIGYSKPGFECIYNIQIMEETQTIVALGAGGISKFVYPKENRIERAFNVKNVKDYILRIDEMIQRKLNYLLTKWM